MRSARTAIALGLALSAWLTMGACEGGGGTAAPAASVDPRTDPRLAVLLQGCSPERSGYYDRDTSDVVAILIEKLVKGHVEPLRRAKEELGQHGAPAVEGLRRLIDRHSTQAMNAPFVENALEALGFNPHPDARPVLLRMLDHPQEGIRRRALAGILREHGQPDDFERLRLAVEGIEQGSLRVTAAQGLFDLDPERARAQLLDWIVAGEQRSVWRAVVAELVETRDPQLIERCADVFADVHPTMRVWCAAVAAQGTSDAARAFLHEELRAPELSRRMDAARACLGAGRLELLLPRLVEESDDTLRTVIVDGLGRAGDQEPRVVDWLQPSLDDPSGGVRSAALQHLVRLGDPSSIDRAVSYLAGRPELVRDGLLALQTRYSSDPPLVQRVWEELQARYHAEAHLPPRDRAPTYKSIGVLPLVEAARFLREEGLRLEGETIEGLRAHEWMMIQASNTGVEGRTWVADQLQGERDFARRLDLIAAVSSARDELARERLLAWVVTPGIDPYELLYLAGRLVRLGPAAQVAERLKRVSHALPQGEVRTALQCLLWTWY